MKLELAKNIFLDSSLKFLELSQERYMTLPTDAVVVEETKLQQKKIVDLLTK